MVIPTTLNFRDMTTEMLELIAGDGDINSWIKAKVDNSADWSATDFLSGIEREEQEANAANAAAGGSGASCDADYYRYIKNVSKLHHQREQLKEYLSFIKFDDKTYGAQTAENSKNLHQMKALYTSQYTVLVDFWINRMRIIYYVILFIYIGILVKNRKYRSKIHIAIAIFLGVYPLVINRIMIWLLSIMEYLFQYTPANAYRNLYNQNINKLEKNDIYLHYTQMPV